MCYIMKCELFLVDQATSSDCYKCELTSVLAAIDGCSSSHYLTSYFFFQLVFAPCKAEQPLRGMELQKKEAQKG